MRPRRVSDPPRPPRPPRTVILNLGFPRTGTTLVQKMFERGAGYFHQKVGESHPYHPMMSSDTVRLVNLFRWKKVIIVRTWREIEDVVESVRVGRELGNLHPWDEEETRRLWRTEAFNWGLFYGAWSNPLPAEETTWATKVLHDRRDPSVTGRLLTVRYGDLIADRGRSILRTVAEETPEPEENFRVWTEYLDRVWGKEPVNVGRLMREVGDVAAEDG